MAHTKQTRKRVRQTEKRNEANRAERSEMRTRVKQFEAAVAAGDKKTIGESFKVVMSALATGARKGLVSKNAAARKVSRLAKRISSQA